jgi:transketolase
LADKAGIHYIRANRKAVREVYETDARFELGKGNILKQGRHILYLHQDNSSVKR